VVHEPTLTLASRLLVAAGGGGGGGEAGAGAGGAEGTSGGNGPNFTEPGSGKGGESATGSTGGAGGAGGSGNSVSGEAGSSGALGTGGQSNGNIAGAGGGGGGGLYGGGAGGTGGRSSLSFNAAGGGGGGGSSLVPAGGTVSFGASNEEPHLKIIFSASPPTAVLGSSIALGPESALLLGSSEGFVGPVTTHFEYGTTGSYGSLTAESSPAFFAVASAVISGLSPATTYRYRLVSTRSDGAVTKSPDATVTTPPAVTVPPPATTSPFVTTPPLATTPPALEASRASCVVPKLLGETLKVARTTLGKADCKLGKFKKLKGATPRVGKVKSQSPKPGKVLAPGSKVSFKLG
jgi:hypothetical protein